MTETQTVFDTSTVLLEIDEPPGSEHDPRREGTGLGLLPAQRRIRNFERDCERLRPLGEAFVMRRFSGSLNRADAEDAVSDAIIRLHRRMMKGRAPDNLRAIFFTSVRNAAIDQLRSRAAKPTVGLDAAATVPSAGPMPLEHAEGREDAVRLQEALKRMRGNYREAIVLRFGMGMTVPEIAQRLEISLPAAKKLVLRATQQVKKRLESIEGEEFCPEMREMAKRSLLEREACGQSSDGIMQAHFQHCGSCKSFLTNLHESHNEIASAALVGTLAAQQAEVKLGIAGHLSKWATDAVHGAQAGAGKMRFAFYKATGVFQSADSTTAGVLSGTGQKIAAICTTGAATAGTCVLAGVAGPGIGATVPPQHDPAPAPIVKEVQSPAPHATQVTESSLESAPVEVAPETAPAPIEPAPQPSPEEAAPAPQPTPVQSEPAPPVNEFGFEGPAASSPPAAAPSSSSSPSSSASKGEGSGDFSGAGFGGGSVSSSRSVGGAVGFQK